MCEFIKFSAPFSKVIEKKTKNTVLSIGPYFVFLLIPFLQNQHAIDTVGYSSISYAYGTTMVDFNIAVGFFLDLVKILAFKVFVNCIKNC